MENTSVMICEHSQSFPFLLSRVGVCHPVLKSWLTTWLDCQPVKMLASVTPQRPEKYLHVLLCSLKNLLRTLLPSWEQFQNNLYTWREDQVGSHSSQSLVWNTLSGWPASWQTLEPIHTDQNYLVGSKLIAKLQSCEPQSLVLVISCGAKCSKT